VDFLMGKNERTSLALKRPSAGSSEYDRDVLLIFPSSVENHKKMAQTGNIQIEPFCQLQVKKKLWVFQTFFKPLKYALFSK
jgi:hypothetical protein